MVLFLLFVSLIFSIDGVSCISLNQYQKLAKNTADHLYSSIAFETKFIEHHNFCEGEVHEYKYPFKNEGTIPIVITSVRSGCGCYTPKWSKLTLPGDSGVVIGRYTSNGRPGIFRRTLTVIFKDHQIPRQTLSVKGYTIPKADCQGKK